jgi:hypothetical protein
MASVAMHKGMYPGALTAPSRLEAEEESFVSFANFKPFVINVTFIHALT